MRLIDQTDGRPAPSPGSAAPPGGRPRAHRVAGRAVVAVPALAALLGGLWGLRRGSMWQDEATTYAVAGRSLPDLWRTLGHVDAVHGLHYLLIHPLLRLADGVSPAEVLIRLPSVLATAVAAAGVAAIGRRLVSAPAGLYAGLAYATAPVVVYHAQEGRSYALVTAAVVTATRLLVVALGEPERGRAWAWYGVAVAAGCLLNLFAVLALVAHAATVVIAVRNGAGRNTALRWAVACAGALLAGLPLAWTAYGQRDQVAWLERPGLPEVEALVSRFAGTGLPLAAAVVLAALGLTAVRPWPTPGPLRRLAIPKHTTPKPTTPEHTTPEHTRPLHATPEHAAVGLAAVAAPLALLPPALLLAVSQVHPLYQDRYVLFAVAGLSLALGAGVARAVRLVPAATGLRAAAALALPALLMAASLPDQAEIRRVGSRPDDPAAVARIVEARKRPGDAVLFLPSIRRLVAEAYPASFRGVADAALRLSGAESGTLAGRELPAGEIAASLGTAPRVWVVSRPHAAPADLSSPRDAAKRLLLREGYRRESTVRVLGYAVRLYVRRERPLSP